MSGSVLRRVLIGAAGPVMRRAGSAYLAGPVRSEAVQVARTLAQAGHRVTLAYWHVESETRQQVADELRAAVQDMAGVGIRPCVAVKAPALGFDVRVVEDLARRSAAAGVGMFFDAHGHSDADATLALARRARVAGAVCGVAVPARWARSRHDALGAAADGLAIRVVKGQWPDPAARVSSSSAADAALRRGFLDVLDAVPGPLTVATHDRSLVTAAVERLVAKGDGGEVELLLGMPARQLLRRAAESGVPVRFYIAYGHPSLSFSVRSTLRRPRLALVLGTAVVTGAGLRDRRVREAVEAGGRGNRG